MPTRIAIDIGGVMTANLHERYDNKTDSYLIAEPFAGCMETITALARRFGPKNLFVVSRAVGRQRVVANHELLVSWHFCERTGIPPQNIIIYDGERAEKARIAVRLGITHMVDDRVEVLCQMPEGVQLIGFNLDMAEAMKFMPKLPAHRDVRRVKNWDELGEYFGVA